MVREILKLGDPELYERSGEITREDLAMLPEWIADLRDTLLDYRRTYGAGRAIAAPQIGIKKRLLYMLTDEETVFIDPVISFPDEEMMDVLDDCMSFPGLCVWVKRHKRAVISYRDVHGRLCERKLEGDLSELLQHEYDHLDGILATMRARDSKAFVLMQMKR